MAWFFIYSGVSNSCRPMFIYKSDFFLNVDEKKLKNDRNA